MFKSRPLSGKMSEKQLMRFERRVCPEAITGCWLWLGNKTADGYAWHNWRFPGQTRNTSVAAHRLAYMHWKGDVPENMTVHHKCENTLCVNPEHLEVLSVRDNIRSTSTHPASRQAAQTLCIRGHEFDHVSKAGTRICKTCEKLRGRKRWHKWAVKQQEENRK